MSTKKYIFRFFLYSLICFLFLYANIILVPPVQNPKDFGDLNVLGAFLELFMFCGIHLIPFYLICIKKISNMKFTFFLLNFSIIILFNQLILFAITDFILTGIVSIENFSKYLLNLFWIQSCVFIVCFFIKQIYYKIRG